MLDWKLRDRFCVKCRKSIRGSSGPSRSRCSCGETVICDGNNLEFILLCWNVRQKIATPETGKFYLRLGSISNEVKLFHWNLQPDSFEPIKSMVKFFKRFGCAFSTPIANAKSGDTPYNQAGFQIHTRWRY